LTLGPGLLVHGGFAEMVPAHLTAAPSWLTNYGTILGDFQRPSYHHPLGVGWFVNYGWFKRP